MHVALDGRVIQDRFPGIGRYVFHLAEALVTLPDGPRVTLFTAANASASDRLDPRFLPDSNRLHRVRVDAAIGSLSAQWQIPRLLRTIDADLWHATYWITPYLPGRPTILSLYDVIGLTQPGAVPWSRRLMLGLTLRLAIHGAAHVVTLSESARDDIRRTLDLPANRITVTPLAADPRFKPPDPLEVSRLQERLDLPPRFILYLGSNKPHKNLAVVAHAWRTLVNDGEHRGAWWVVAGHQDPRYPVAGTEPPPPRTRVLGPVAEADLPTLYGAADAFVFPSRAEGFGLPVLEAMSCGTPVVVSDASSLPEVVADAGLRVPPGDPARWSDAIRRILADGAYAGRVARDGLERARCFAWTDTARRTLDAYRRTIDSA